MDQITTISGSERSELIEPESGGKEFASDSQLGKSEAFTVDHLSQGRYNQYGIDTRYITSTGYDVLACGQPDSNDAENVIIKVSNGVTEKWIFWTVERENTQPLLPALTTSDPNEIAISQEILFANAYTGMNGALIWRVSGVNKYKLLKAKTATSKYPVGSTPAELATALSRFYGPEQFVTTIIDASAGATVIPTLNLQTAIPKVGT